MNAKQGRAFRQDVTRGLRDAQNREYRAKLAKLDAELQAIKDAGRERLKHQRNRCGGEYKVAQQKARTEIDRIRAERDHKKTTCALEAEQVKAEAAAEARIAAQKIEAERAHKKELARIDTMHKEREKHAPRAKAGERLAESNEAVEADLSPREIVIWRKIRGSIKATPGRSRAEGLRQAIHDAGGLAKMEASMGLGHGPNDRDLQREREQYEADQAARGGKRLPKGATRVSPRKWLGPVPFRGQF